MAERALIVAELKRALRESGHTYADVAQKLELSVASVKRLFSTEDLSLQRVDEFPLHKPLSQNELLYFARTSQRPIADLDPMCGRFLR